MAETVQLAARGLAAGRAALGAAMLVRPELVTQPWIGADGATPGARTLTRGFGARDVAIGLAGALARNDGAMRTAIAGGIISDVADAATALLEDSKPSSGRMMTLAIASGAAAVGVWVFTQLD